MRNYFLRKLMMLPLILLGVSFIVFMSVRALPGDPARLMAGPEATQDAVDDMRVRLGLDRPLMVQYAAFLKGAATGDFGTSIRSQRPVSQELSRRYKATMELATVAYFFATIIGVPAGMIAAICKGRAPDHVVMVFAILGASVANFWLALVMMDYFSVQKGWLPLLGSGSAAHFVMPAIVLGLLPMALIARMTRSSMIETLDQDYIRTARAKGLGAFQVYQRHALRNALIPIVTIIGLNFGAVIGSTVVTETVFNWPGIGRLLVDAVRYRDYPIIQGVTLLAVVSVVLVNFFAEFLISVLDPRVRFN
ncbi:ABC transporter permease [Roseinatronobacter sp. S2]|uniref:ABC transporter permease n=1 Tax=Roseinatronobacter sp. S2 TaxID=3035471 RepID=UPI00241094F1|nr:ABC transporter permease [Roseinatronobacter sp. S2]MCC5958959.1 ABC transporter permease [Paracoccaceae bacterium]WFE75820.1 ABC transporter permease [Roseinatronobacter sp. S2]